MKFLAFACSRAPGSLGLWAGVALMLFAIGQLAPSVQAQTSPATAARIYPPGTIAGSLVAANDGEAVAGARLRVVGTELRTIANDAGEFVFPSVPPGTYALVVQADAMMPVRVTDIIVRPTETTALGAVRLWPNRHSRDGLVVDGYVVDADRVRAVRSTRNVDEVVELSPFEVHIEPTGSYGAIESNSLTAFRVDWDKLPATAEVFTRTLMDDLAATSVEDMLLNYGGVTGLSPGDVASVTNGAEGDRNGLGGFSIRGMSVGGLKRDSFLGMRVGVRSATGSTDNFSTERVEVIQGPQSLLYGGSGGGGIVNLVPKRANFRQREGLVRFMVDNYGSKRALLDYNLGGERISARVALVESDFRNFRYNLGGRFEGLYVQTALRLTPNLTLRLWGERNSTDSNHAGRIAANLNNFLPLGDPRTGLDPRFLALTGQVSDLSVIDGGLNYGNLESLYGWWASERIVNSFTGFSFEASLDSWLSAHVVASYGDTLDSRIDPTRSVVPMGALGNPFDRTAALVVPGDNDQPSRAKGFRATLLAQGRFFGDRAFSQTALGIEATATRTHDSIDYKYYLADENWNVVVDPAKTTDYGRTQLTSVAFPVQGGVPSQPLFRPRTARVTLNGKNYVRLAQVTADPAQSTPQNIYGLVPNNGASFLGRWSQGDTHTRSVFLSNHTTWLDGKFTTLTGARFSRTTAQNVGVSSSTINTSYRPPWDETLTGNLGFTLRLRDDLRAYASVSTSYNSLIAQTRDLHGQQLLAVEASAPAPEVGLRYSTFGDRVIVQLGCNFVTDERNQATTVGAEIRDLVNPPGINGAHASPDQWVNVDRSSRSMNLVVTAQPTRQWRLRFSATALDGEISSDVNYAILYNDQFFTRGQNVTYRDGTPMFVDPAGANGARTSPLTLAMINDPTSRYYAAPDPDSGAITNPTLRAALMETDPIRGSAATGVTGLPLSQIQYAWADPNQHNGAISVFRKGERTTGLNEFNLNLQSNYTFSTGPLRGVGVFTAARTYQRNRAYYVQSVPTGGRAINGERTLYRLPPATVFDLGLSYRRELGPCTWTTQLNVQNLFNHYRVWILPQANGGAYTQARLSTAPRRFVWTNSFEF